jgi:hypothetical protein
MHGSESGRRPRSGASDVRSSEQPSGLPASRPRIKRAAAALHDTTIGQATAEPWPESGTMGPTITSLELGIRSAIHHARHAGDAAVPCDGLPRSV